MTARAVPVQRFSVGIGLSERMQPLLQRQVLSQQVEFEFDLSAVDNVFWRALHSNEFCAALGCRFHIGRRDDVARTADDTSFDEIVAEDKTPVLVDFWAPWCKPCQALTPILEKVEAAGNNRFRLIKVNADECTAVTARFNVRSLPTLVLLAGGEPVSRKVGSPSQSALEEWISQFC